jgi:hypothetical protein
MTAFFGGVVFGFLLAGSAFIIFITGRKRPPRDIEVWKEEAYRSPVVTTRVLIKERTYDI